MPEWLPLDSPLVIALVGCAGTVILGLCNLFASRRDKATANTITELRTIIERLGLDLDRARQAQADGEAVAKRAEDKAKLHEERAAALAAELTKLREVAVFGTWLAMTHDPTPKAPLCPDCYANNKVVRMRQEASDSDGVVKNWFVCGAHQKPNKVPIAPDEADALFAFLGARGCYNPGPAKSSKPPPPSRPRGITGLG